MVENIVKEVYVKNSQDERRMKQKVGKEKIIVEEQITSQEKALDQRRRDGKHCSERPEQQIRVQKDLQKEIKATKNMKRV